MKIFDVTQEQMDAHKARFTLEEIRQQPGLWEKTRRLLQQQKASLSAFLKPLLEADLDLVLSGAGTSAFVGECLAHALGAQYAQQIRAVSTTDLVAAPARYLHPTKTTLLINFARSGNSPESVATVQMAEQVAASVSHLFITCNSEGALNQLAKEMPNAYSLVLDPATNDRGFAMTSSFSNMVLAAYLALDQEGQADAMVAQLVQVGEDFLAKDYGPMASLGQEGDFDRIVYLGALALKGFAQESALKMLELSAGRVATLFDTPLGFRHGPKSFISAKTLLVMYLSDDPYRRQYSLDLLKEMSGQRAGNRIIVLHNRPCEGLEDLVDGVIRFDVGAALPSLGLGLLYILFAQGLAVYKSMALGLTPDNPFPTGEVNRVVQGVVIYPLEGQDKEEDRA